MSEKLKPCPFCGGEAAVKNDFSEWSFIVRCKNCGAETRTFILGLDEVPDDEIVALTLAINAWNRRVQS